MAGNPYGANQYKQMAIKTANRGQILIMLYEAAIQHVKKASAAIKEGNVSAKGMHIGKIHDIVSELTATLDHKVGGKIAEDLERLYNFIIEQLLKANVENSTEALQTVEKLLTTLLDGWRVAVQEAQKNAPQEERSSG